MDLANCQLPPLWPLRPRYRPYAVMQQCILAHSSLAPNALSSSTLNPSTHGKAHPYPYMDKRKSRCHEYLHPSSPFPRPTILPIPFPFLQHPFILQATCSSMHQHPNLASIPAVSTTSSLITRVSLGWTNRLSSLLIRHRHPNLRYVRLKVVGHVLATTALSIFPISNSVVYQARCHVDL